MIPKISAMLAPPMINAIFFSCGSVGISGPAWASSWLVPYPLLVLPHGFFLHFDFPNVSTTNNIPIIQTSNSLFILFTCFLEFTIKTGGKITPINKVCLGIETKLLSRIAKRN